MALSAEQREEIKSLLINKITQKLNNPKPEAGVMPFHFRLIGKDRMSLFSFIHSINTSLGTSIFEQIGEIVIKPRCSVVNHQYKYFKGYISDAAQVKITEIINDLIDARIIPNQKREINEIKKAAKTNSSIAIREKRVDIFVKYYDGSEIHFEFKSAKPNMNEFKGIKRDFLESIAMRASQDSSINFRPILAIPYNPYDPKPYERWTLKGLFDLDCELLVGKELWDFLGGVGTYEELLELFEECGKEMNNLIKQFMPNQS